MSTTELHHGDCLEVLASMPSDSVAAIVTDPPYGLSFMGKGWDYQVPSVEIWEQCLRVLKPGGHLLAFAGTRTQHRMCVNIEDAGFEIRDMIAWVYGSGFPKSQNVGKAIDKAAGAERERYERGAFGGTFSDDGGTTYGTAISDTPITSEAQQWNGWGTALKPALEPITVARKPFKGTVANNVLTHGTGAINIDGCRVEGTKGVPASLSSAGGLGWSTGGDMERKQQQNGRWPANLIHDGSDEVVGLFPQSNSSATPRNRSPRADRTQWRNGGAEYNDTAEYGDSGSAARFFYTAKASKDDRDKGNTHPTVKPTDLMAYLCRLVTPPGGVVLDPFMGSGTTGKAALSEGFSFIGIERDAEYYAICESRVNGAQIGLALAV